MKRLYLTFVSLLSLQLGFALNPAHFSINRITSPYFMVDSNVPTTLTTAYVGFEIFNNSSSATTYNNIFLQVDSVGASEQGRPFTVVSPVPVLASLPLIWSSFRIYPQAGQVQLVWQTYLEQGTQDYRIWRSRDGKDWSALGSVNAACNSLNLQTYHFTDADPGAGQLYYRIEQRDLSGQSSFSKTVNLAFDPHQTLLTILNNPVRSGQLNFRLSEAATLTVIGQNGARLLQQYFVAGTHTLDLGSLMPGTYIIAGAGPAQRILLIR